MINLLRKYRLALIPWLIQVVALLLLWKYLPSQTTATLLVLIVVANAALLHLKQLELPTFTNVALTLSLLHFYQSAGSVSALVGAITIFASVFITGLTGRIAQGNFESVDVLAWLIIGLFTSQIAALTQFWPISFFQKAILGTTVFYLVWQMWETIDRDSHEVKVHFIFVGLAVMVIITSIAWTTWPGLNNF